MGQLEQFHREMREFDLKYGPQDYYTRRLREKREEEERKREERERSREPKPQPQQQPLATFPQPTEDDPVVVVHDYKTWMKGWDAWCDARIGHAIFDKDGCLHHEFAKMIAYQRNEWRTGIESLRRKLLDEIDTKLARLPLEVKTWEPVGEALDQIRQQEQACSELQTAVAALSDKIAMLGDELNAATSKLQERLARLPLVKSWDENEISYCGDVVTHDGNLYQARKDTGKEPPHRDWILLARAGRDGLHGCTPRFRDVFNAYERYQHRDIVTCDGNCYIACRDNPGLPGHDEGWKILARGGGRGPAGEVGPRGRKGERGARGEAAPAIVSWVLDYKRYTAIPTLSDGTAGTPLELRGLFEQFLIETGGLAAE